MDGLNNSNVSISGTEQYDRTRSAEVLDVLQITMFFKKSHVFCSFYKLNKIQVFHKILNNSCKLFLYVRPFCHFKLF